VSLGPLSRSPDLQRLRGEGYEVWVTPGVHLVVDHVPYVTPAPAVAYGRLVSKLVTAGEVTATPIDDHVVFFAGETPCDQNGQPLTKIINQSQTFQLEGDLAAQHSFSSKPANKYPDYYVKMTTYVKMLAGHAQALDPEATAQTYRVLPETDPTSPFVYPDTASSRAGIAALSDKLRLARVAIVGLGGTGSYILDLVAKTHVHEIHLFDGDDFLSHNAFRAPGAATMDQLNARPTKVEYLAERYSAMRRGIVAHPQFIDAGNVGDLVAMDFVFLSMEGGSIKQLIVERLQEHGVPFIDVGLGVEQAADSLMGVLAVTTSTPNKRNHVFDKHRIDFSDPAPNAIYDDNIQIADLNALNAALAVIKWKKLYSFYVDLEHEHFSAYTIDGNHLVNEDQA
jgi:hypothetical protein